jgi:predicted YcjX-like family ATPase
MVKFYLFIPFYKPHYNVLNNQNYLRDALQPLTKEQKKQQQIQQQTKIS